MKKKVVLAYSGGLDTCYCVKYLSNELGMDVYSVFANTGSFSDEECQEIYDKAKILGVKNHITVDISGEFYNKCIRYLVYGNILRNNNYPLSVSSERGFQAMAIAKYAKESGAEYIAHGSTGAGNDQIRFDMIFQILCPDLEIITPVRDKRLSRSEEIDYLKSKGINLDWKETEYSINKGLWGTSIGGNETLTSIDNLQERAYPAKLTENNMCSLSLNFYRGELSGINDKKIPDTVEAIRILQKTASKYAIGRGMHVGDTIIGIKGRVAFEAAAPLLIINAHQTLEKHILSKWQIYWKEQISNWYGMLLHEGQYLDPVMRDIEMFLDNSQQKVSGKVKILLKPYHFEICGIVSDYDLMNSEFATYGEINNSWNSDDVKGFTKIFANPLRIYHHVNNKTDQYKL